VSRRLLSALLLVAFMVIVIILNAGGRVNVDFRLFDFTWSRPVVFFLFTSVGVIIGLLLK